MITRIHINRHRIQANAKHGINEPVITVKRGKSTYYGHQVFIAGPSHVIYRPEKPLPCGAKVWIETRATVSVDHEEIL
jgi:hypothetical protein